jgi:hypothetical protein
MDHPDEMRVDLDPVPGVPWATIVEVAQVARAVLEEHGLAGWPKTSGSRGVHVLVRIAPRWPFTIVRKAALALAREVERRAPSIATSAWWKEERHGVFLDYNQNARDRTTASAYSVRPTADARVSMPLSWDELASCDPAAFTIATVPALFATRGDAHARIEEAPGAIDGLLALAEAQEAGGAKDAPWPPHFEKGETEGTRVTPSRARGRTSKQPLVTIANARTRAEAVDGLERWKTRHPEVAGLLAPDDVLIDTMRGRSAAWYRVRINLRHVPAGDRPVAEKPDPDWDPAEEWRGAKRGGEES